MSRAERLFDRMGEPLDPDDYDWSAAADSPVTADEVFQLTYAAQVEWATEGTFESLDITRDPTVSRFLRIWLEQERVHGELLDRFLNQTGVDVTLLHREPRHRRGARRGKRPNQLAHRFVGDDFFAVHMAWGAVNELTTLRFYQVIRQRTSNPLLSTILGDIIAQEALHYAFYRESAIERLDGNERAQRITRYALTHLWRPVGLGLRCRSDVDRLLGLLLAPKPDLVRQIDASIASMPGLASTRLIESELAAVTIRAAA